MTTSLWDLSLSKPKNQLLNVTLSGDWLTRNYLPDISQVKIEIEKDPAISSIYFNCDELKSFDTGLVFFLDKLIRYSAKHNISIDLNALPQGVKRLLKIVSSAPHPSTLKEKKIPFITQMGLITLNRLSILRNQTTFIGEIIFSFSRLILGKAFFLKKDLLRITYASSIKAIGIVGLIAFLTGTILAFIGSVELTKFGAAIYIANLTSVGMARELGPIMTAIVMSGRTGAAFAAIIGTMKLNQEIDALSTTAISPMDFVVLPRLIALITIMPILTIYAIVLGNLGGYVIGMYILKISSMEYINQVKDALTITDNIIGIIKGFIFGTLVAFSGCFRGVHCGRNALAVGEATTLAVVSSIILIISADAIIDFILHVLEL